MEGKIKYC